jgi:hypothetical protein
VPTELGSPPVGILQGNSDVERGECHAPIVQMERLAISELFPS